MWPEFDGLKSDQLSIVNDSGLTQLGGTPSSQPQIGIDANRLTLGVVLRLLEGENLVHARVTAIQTGRPPQGERIVRNCRILPPPYLNVSINNHQMPMPCFSAAPSTPIRPLSGLDPRFATENLADSNQAIANSSQPVTEHPKEPERRGYSAAFHSDPKPTAETPPGPTPQHAAEYHADQDQPAANPPQAAVEQQAGQVVARNPVPTPLPRPVGQGFAVIYRHNIKVDGTKAYINGGVLGGGSFGKVYLVLKTKELKQYAMKTIDLSKPFGIETGKYLRREVMIHYQVQGSAFLLNMADIWYSSKGYLHILTVRCLPT